MNLSPPPSKVELVKSSQADAIWKKWLNLLYQFFQVEAWHAVGATDEPAFENSWANTGTSPASFYKDPFDVVRLRGNINTGLTATTAFTLPVDYRPPYTTIHIVYNNNGGPGPGGANVFVTVNTTGTVVPTFSAGTDMWLDGISFRV